MENLHTAQELKELQALPLEQKIQLSTDRIREFYRTYNGRVAVSFSGGKDSTALLHLVRTIYPDTEAVYINTGLEYPEINEFVNQTENVVQIRPKKSFRQVIAEYGYPVISKEISMKIEGKRQGKAWRNKYFDGTQTDKQGRLSRYAVTPKWHYLLDAPFEISNKCCDIMKKETARRYEKESGNKMYIGTLAEESLMRQQAWLRTGCNAFETQRPKSTPLAFWTNQDVLRYLKNNEIPIAEIYGDITEDGRGQLTTTGAERTGCMFCMFGAHLEKEPNRFQRMQRTHPKIYEYCMRPREQGGLGLKEVCDYIGIETEQTQTTLEEMTEQEQKQNDKR